MNRAQALSKLNRSDMRNAAAERGCNDCSHGTARIGLAWLY